MAKPLGSIAYQVSKIVNSINGIGKSKKESRELSGIRSIESGHKISDKVHSVKSMQNLRDNLKNLATYAKAEHGIKDISKINAQVVKDWLQQKNTTYHTASNYLSEINKVSEHLSITRTEVAQIRNDIKPDLAKSSQESRAYKNLDQITLSNSKAQIAFELQRDHGLRVSAATHINSDKQLAGNTLTFAQKGGKLGTKELSENLINRIRENSINGKFEINNRTYSRELQKEIEKTQEYNGTHGIRHTYAQERLEKGATKEEVSEELGHSREEITNVYLR